MEQELPQIDSIAETAQNYGLDQQHLYRLVNSGVIPAGVAIRMGRRWFIHRAHFVEWLEAGGAAYRGGWKKAA